MGMDIINPSSVSYLSRYLIGSNFKRRTLETRSKRMIPVLRENVKSGVKGI